MKPIFVVGHPRTGTRSMSFLFSRVLTRPDVRGTHQQHMPIRDLEEFLPYCLEEGNLPIYIERYITEYEKHVMSLEAKGVQTMVECDWAKSFVMKALGDRFPESRFIVLLRDVEAAANSNKHYQNLNGWHPEKRDNIDYYVLNWLRIYRFILEQMRRMKNEIWVLSSGALFRGCYNELLLGFIEEPATDENLKKVERHFRKKINHAGTYKIDQISPASNYEAKQLMVQLFVQGRGNDPSAL